MSIASEITRLQTAKANLKTAINAKGGSLTTETIDQYASVVDTISTGTDISDANAVVGDVLTGKTFYSTSGGKKTGTMADNGTVNTDITTKAQEVTIAGGKHSGSGKVKISSTEQAKIISDNIKSGVTILGQAGAVTPAKAEETKTITSPDFSSGNIVVTPTTDKVMTQVTVNKDTTNHKSENIKDGVTLYGIEGSLTPAKAEETKTITSPDFSSGNIEVTPTTDKVMTKVTINKDTTNHKSENIKDGITLYGVAGTYEGGGVTFGGYSITIDVVDDGFLDANILCEYDGSYGWHHLQLGSDQDGLVINNASLLVTSMYTYSVSVSVGVGNLKTYDGTSISTEAQLNGAVNKLCYLTGNITLHFND